MRGFVMSSMTACMALAAVVLAPTVAAAHVAITSGAVVADTSQEITFGVGHGCSGADTYSLKIDIPAGVASVRAVPNVFGRVTVQKDAAQVVTSVTWTRPEGDASALFADDDGYYKVSIRIKVPKQPFTTLYFPTHQVCKKRDGTTSTAEWVAATQSETEDPNAPKPAPALLILPAAKRAGWNKWTVTQPLTVLGKVFDDAEIVWKGTAAFSANPVTLAQAKATAGVTELTSLAVGDEIWVKY